MDLQGGTVRLADSGDVSGLAFSPDESLLAVARDYAVELCDGATGRPLRVLAGHTGNVRALAFAPDGRRLVTAARDHTVRVWDVPTATLTLRVTVDYPGAVRFFPDGTRIAVGAGSGDILVVDEDGGISTFWTGRTRGTVESLAFSPDGTLLAAVDYTGRCRVHEAATGAIRFELRRGRHHPVGLAFTPDGSGITVVDQAGTIRVRDLAGARVRTVTKAAPKPKAKVQEVAFPAGGARVVATPHEITRSLAVRDAATGAVTATLEGVEGLVTALAAGEKRIALGDSEGRVQIWPGTGGQPVVSKRAYNPVWDVRCSPDGKLLTTLSNNGDLHLWEIATGRVRDRFPGDLHHPVGAAFTPDGTGLAVAGLTSPPQVRDLADGHVRLTLDQPPDTTSTIVYSPDGRRLITFGTLGRDNRVRVWNAATGALEHSLEASPDRVVCSPDGETVALLTTWRIVLWHLPTGGTGTLFDSPSEGRARVTSALAFSPDGRLIAAGADRNDIWIWPRDNPADRRVLPTGRPESVHLLAYSPDGARLAVGPFDGAPRVLDASTGALIREFVGHYHRITALAFAPDGATLLTASIDGTARRWDASTGELLATYVPRSAGGGLAIFPDGRVVGDPGNRLGPRATWQS